MFSGDLVDLGTFTSALHKHDVTLQMNLGFSFSSSRRGPFWGPPLRPRSLTRSIDISLELAPSNQRERHYNARLSSVKYAFDEKGILSVELKRRQMTQGKDSDSPEVSMYRVANMHSSISLVRFLRAKERADFIESESNVAALRAIVNKIEVSPEDAKMISRVNFSPYGFLPSFPYIPDIANIDSISQDARGLSMASSPLEGIRREFSTEVQSISYLGPLRSHPARHYLVSGADTQSVGKQGEHMPQMLWRRKKDVVPKINEKFAEFQIPYKIDVKAVGDDITGEIITIQLSDEAGITVSPADVGFGIGQLLPILVEGVVSSGKTICVEQPEIHLHPKLQAHIADFLIETAKSFITPRQTGRSAKEFGGNQWIVETHSESLMLRLQKRISEGLPPDFVSVLYVQPMANGSSRVERLRLDKDGDFIDEWPDGFFEEGYREIFGGK